MQNEFSNCTKEEIQTFYTKVSKNIKELRKKRNISQLEISLEIGIKSVAFYCNCENNKNGKHFNLEHLYKIAKFLDIKMCDLLPQEKA